MGRAIIALSAERSDLRIAGAIECEGHPDLGKDAGVTAGVAPLNLPITSDLRKALRDGQVIVDFSSRTSTLACAEVARKTGKAMVIGTTGLSGEDIAKIKKAAEAIPIVLSPNMSVGVNLLFQIADQAASKLTGYDIEIVEIHHNKKKDAPSGTAKRLAQIVAEATGRDLSEDGVYGREGLIGERKPEEIGVHAVRAGDVVGEHTVIFAGPGERIELTHRAHSRNTFAAGALRAALFAAKATPGLYSMLDVLAG
jgi:4-hydroxy-tetrahydrodipicolinate reductase